MESPKKSQALGKGNKSENNGEDDWEHNAETPKRTTGSKHFMTQTISAASKASKKKILGERNDASDSYLPKFGTPRTKQPCQKENESASKIRDSSAPRAKFVRYNPERRREAFAKKESEPTHGSSYDPIKNYLSPRPKFLWYDPDRSRERLVRNNCMFGDDDSFANSDQSEQADDAKCLQETLFVDQQITEARAIQCEQDDAPTYLAEESEEKTASCELDKDNVESNDDDEERSVWGLRRVIKVVLFLYAVALSASFIFSSNEGGNTVRTFPPLDYEAYNWSSYHLHPQQTSTHYFEGQSDYVDQLLASTHYFEGRNDDDIDYVDDGMHLHKNDSTDDVEALEEEGHSIDDVKALEEEGVGIDGADALEEEGDSIDGAEALEEQGHGIDGAEALKEGDGIIDGAEALKEEGVGIIDGAKALKEEGVGIDSPEALEEESEGIDGTEALEEKSESVGDGVWKHCMDFVEEDVNEDAIRGDAEEANKTKMEAIVPLVMIAVVILGVAGAGIRKRRPKKTETKEINEAGTPVVKLLHEMDFGSSMMTSSRPDDFGSSMRTDNNLSIQSTDNEDEATGRSSRKKKMMTPVRRSTRLQQSRALI